MTKRLRDRSWVGSVLWVAALAMVSIPSVAQEEGGSPDIVGDIRGSDVAGGAGARDNTRVHGFVYDSTGNTLSEVQVWARNHNSPAVRLRARSRKTGSYLIRSIERLYTRDDVYGIAMRLQFEKTGYRTVEVVTEVAKNGLTRVFPILYREDEEPEMPGICAVLVGSITNAKGKGVKGATVMVKAADGSGFETEVAADKSGDYELLLWQAPEQVTVSVSSPSGSQETGVKLQASPAADAFLSQTLDIQIGS